MALTLVEREEISRALAVGQSIRHIAMRLGEPHPPSAVRSTVTVVAEATAPTRLIRRHGTGLVAQSFASLSSPQSWRSLLRRSFRPVVARADCWVVEAYLPGRGYQVSHETIYRSLFIQARGALKKELLEYLRRSRYTPVTSSHQKTGNHGRISDTTSISERPAIVEDRAVPGHWEGDLLCGSKNSQIATLVERHSRYVMLVKVNGKDTETVVNALIENAQRLPQELYQSLTWDRGKEMAAHKRFTLATDIQVYFVIHRILGSAGRMKTPTACYGQYFPKGTDLCCTRRTRWTKSLGS
ncbi:IS30 family transposase [Pseudomonas aeruginosa]|nr:IS30 family transposase [Pseudomonas aeruginosa]